MKSRTRKAALLFCPLCGEVFDRSADGSVLAHTCAPIAEGMADGSIACGPACSCHHARPPAVELDMSKDEGLERTKRFFFEWEKGARVTTDHDITYVCDDVDGSLPAGSVGTVVRRVMAGLYVVRWDVMPAHELQTSADCLFAAPAVKS